jgi:hypothetical protein
MLYGLSFTWGNAALASVCAFQAWWWGLPPAHPASWLRILQDALFWVRGRVKFHGTEWGKLAVTLT